MLPPFTPLYRRASTLTPHCAVQSKSVPIEQQEFESDEAMRKAMQQQGRDVPFCEKYFPCCTCSY